MNIRISGALLILGLIWGASFLLIKIGLYEIRPLTLVAMRLGLAALVLVALLYGTGKAFPRDGRLWRAFAISGIIGLIFPFVLITWGEQAISSGQTAILNATTPLFTLLISTMSSREDSFGGWKLAGVLLGFLGVVVAVGVADLRLDAADTRGQLAILGASLCYGINGVFARQAFRGQPPLIPASGQMLMATLVLTPFALAFEGVPSQVPSFGPLLAVVTLAIVCTAIAYILFYWLLDRAGATRSSMVTYLLPPIALCYGVIFLNETISAQAIAGLVLVLLGIMLANGLIAPRRAAVA